LVGKRVALTSVQKIPTAAINIRRVVSPFAFYTCPAGKKAIVKGTAEVTGTGAAATVDLNAAGTSIAEWQSAGGNLNDDVPQNMAIGVRFFFEIQLDAGETIDYDQNAGTNAEMNFNAEVHETPV